MDCLAFDELVVFAFADLLLDLIDGELLLEVEDIVEHLDPQFGDVVEKVGVRPVFVVHDIGQGKKLILGLEDGLLGADESDESLAEILVDTEGDESPIHDIGLKAVVAEWFDQVNDVSNLAGVDDTEAIDVPLDIVADFVDPPIYVFAEADGTPFKSGFRFRHRVELAGAKTAARKRVNSSSR
ncbi:MAG: hypothetical protein EA425_11815 [Puniceicoccaceae bacterium]|nr:MAG: hypothetical protein EA425_11815 [Puniceicoccaceae bacterium]